VVALAAASVATSLSWTGRCRTAEAGVLAAGDAAEEKVEVGLEGVR
jgi:hypothetical protein